MATTRVLRQMGPGRRALFRAMIIALDVAVLPIVRAGAAGVQVSFALRVL